jgi:pyruvate dehydrogenase E1 component alpha subunit
MGAHTTSDDPTKYRDSQELADWTARDPISRYEIYLRSLGVGDDFFADVATEAEDLAADVRRQTLALVDPPSSKIFAKVYSDPHPLMERQSAWLEAYQSSLDGDALEGEAG